jgi:hypothetical protein
MRTIQTARDQGGFARTTRVDYWWLAPASKRARSSPLMTRVCPVTVNVARDRMSPKLPPALSSTGPASITRSLETPV